LILLNKSTTPMNSPVRGVGKIMTLLQEGGKQLVRKLHNQGDDAARRRYGGREKGTPQNTISQTTTGKREMGAWGSVYRK